MLAGGPGDADLDELITQAEREVAALGQLQQRLTGVTGEGYGPRNLAHARTSASGLLEELSIDPRGMRLSSHELAEEIVAATRAAATQASERIAEMYREIFGRELPVGGPGGASAASDLARDPEIQDALNGLARARYQLG
ncbi:MAG TPA: YbaB/EbfC family nucleoid-associated protein [Micromonosporaceae bacterium]